MRASKLIHPHACAFLCTHAVLLNRCCCSRMLPAGRLFETVSHVIHSPSRLCMPCAAAQSQLVAHLLRRYTVKGILGQGTFGQVVECVSDTSPEAPVAVKVIKNQAAFYHQVCASCCPAQSSITIFHGPCIPCRASSIQRQAAPINGH